MKSWLERLRQIQNPCILVTVTRNTGSTPREPGAKMIVFEDGQFEGTIGGGNLEKLAIEDARRLLKEKRSDSIRYPLGAKTGQCCGGIVDLFFDVLNQSPQLYVFGAGHVGQAVSRVFSDTPFEVHLIDSRPSWINSAQIAEGTRRHAIEWDEAIESLEFSADRSYAAIMTHNHDLDFQILCALLKKKTKYLGMIGSHSKWMRFKRRLAAREDANISHVHCPLGLNTGGRAPQEVAISLAAELLQIHYQRGIHGTRTSRSGKIRATGNAKRVISLARSDLARASDRNHSNDLD